MNMRVLIADDSKPMRELVARSLHKATTSSLDIEFASDGEEALATAMEWRPHLIFSDWNMPKLDGIAFLELYREHFPDTPFVMVTSEHSDSAVNEATQKGANGLIAKPFKPDDFRPYLDKAVSLLS